MVKPRNLNLAVLRNDPNEIYEGTCLSTDTKPTNWPDNSILFELDTGTRYYSNSGTWYPVGGGADSGSGGGGGDYVVFLHNYNTGELQYRSTIELAEIDETKKVDFYIADVDEITDDIPWGFAMPCSSFSYASYGGGVNIINLSAGTSTLIVETVSWEIVNGEVTNLTFSDSSYSMYEQTGE